MLKKMIFEFLSSFENLFLIKNTKSLAEKKLIVLGALNADNYMLFCGAIIPSGGCGTALRVASSLMSNTKLYAVVMESAGVLNLNEIVKLFPSGTLVNEINASELYKNKNIIFTNWQSYHKFSFYESAKKYMFVQDCEYWFFPKGRTYFQALEPYADINVHKICLGKWIFNEVERYRGKNHYIDFPVTLNEKFADSILKVENGNIEVLIYVKHSFRRAGGVLLEQLRQVPSFINGRKMRYVVYGYKPSTLFKFYYYNKNVKFLGYIKEASIIEQIKRCDIGVVYSCTNVSLFPFQLAAAKKPVIDLKNGGAEIDQLDCAKILINSNKESLNDGLMEYVSNKIKYDSIAQNNNFINYSIDDVARQFNRIIAD